MIKINNDKNQCRVKSRVLVLFVVKYKNKISFTGIKLKLGGEYVS